VVDQKLAFKYPWMESARRLLEEFRLLSFDLEDILEHSSPVVDAILPRVREIIQDGIERQETLRSYYPEDPNNLVLFPILKMVLSALKEKSVIFQVANAFSKHTRGLLNEERTKGGQADTNKFLAIARDLGWVIEVGDEQFGNEVFPFHIRFESYIPLSVKMKDPHWKLTNQKLQKGFVYLAGLDLTRLFEEYCKQKILEVAEIHDPELREKIRKSPVFGSFIAEIDQAVAASRAQFPFQSDFAHITQKEMLFPPCIKVIYSKILQGMNLTHLERLFFAFFLLNVGYDVDGVLDVFRNSPDFDDKIARYQIEHSAGLKGRGVKYNVHSCSKLKSYRLCYATDPEVGHEWCANTDPNRKPINNPMSFVRRMAWLLERNGNNILVENTNSPEAPETDNSRRGE
jgi:DNA primase large subunit